MILYLMSKKVVVIMVRVIIIMWVIFFVLLGFLRLIFLGIELDSELLYFFEVRFFIFEVFVVIKV